MLDPQGALAQDGPDPGLLTGVQGRPLRVVIDEWIGAARGCAADRVGPDLLLDIGCRPPVVAFSDMDSRLPDNSPDLADRIETG